uniref:Uncharacterized protein n=1 Tax=Lepeophtheirus salmonis TaxID=72036 RepID=A0A0K2UQR9_LEPSM
MKELNTNPHSLSSNEIGGNYFRRQSSTLLQVQQGLPRINSQQILRITLSLSRTCDYFILIVLSSISKIIMTALENK